MPTNTDIDEIKKLISCLVTQGQIARLPKTQWTTLSPARGMELIRTGMLTAPLTHRHIETKTKTEIRSSAEINEFPLRKDDFLYMTEKEGKEILNFFLKRSDNIKKRLSDTDKATPAQMEKIKKLMSDGFLHPIHSSAWITLSKITAKKMIFAGEQNKAITK